ncbi:YoaK family protein [Arenibacter sp. GZD96]|uniref:YoaK family protein n=1 Tax=Aurantibrevibacter litoralis TaxID=3106030 RepID=UPI002AFF4278|nr:YoaK family protein [Arenibacter sp. GZD-96]MEA1785683.1 YoaK family protein [Arenibacter sp. GZD-96]
MLRKYNNSRTLGDNKKLGALTAFSAGMVNVASVIVFFAFTSNVTGHFAILAEEIAKKNWYQAAVVFTWIFSFFIGNFTSNFIVIHSNKRNRSLSHAIPLCIEIICLLSVGIYGQYFYQETLTETEIMIGLLLFAMGIQNGLTATISNFAVKTTHLTGLTTDLGILLAMFTKRVFRENEKLVGKAQLLMTIASSYLIGGILSGILYLNIQFKVFFVVCFVILIILVYDYSKLKVARFVRARKTITPRWNTITSES